VYRIQGFENKLR